MTTPVTGYPRWDGALSKTPRFWSIAAQEVRNALRDQWARTALIVGFGYALIVLATLYSVVQTRPSAHSREYFLDFLGLLRWAALAVAAVMAGPALLEDDRKGALELYLSRSVTRPQYLAGKLLAVLGLTFVTIFGPALLYWGGTWLLADEHPAGWGWAPLGAAGYAAIWAIVVSGLGLGLSCVVRSSRAATLLLFGGLVVIHLVLANLLEFITRSETLQVMSPLNMLQAQQTWLFQMDAPFEFPWWWGLVGLGALAALGWTLVALRHPRLKGVA